MHFNLAFIGFGTVGQGLSKLLIDKKEILKERHNLEYEVVAVSDKIKGSVYKEDGLDLEKLLKIVEQTGKVAEYPDGIKDLDAITTIRESNADVIVEVTYTNIKTGEPAITHLQKAFESGTTPCGWLDRSEKVRRRTNLRESRWCDR